MKFWSAEMRRTGHAQNGPIARLGDKLFIIIGIYFVVMILARCQAEPVNGSASIGDAYFPELGNGGYDVQKYTLILHVEPVPNELVATQIIEATALERLASFNLDFQGLIIDRVRVNDTEAIYQRQGYELVITPPRILPSGKPFFVEIQYHGKPEPIEMITSPMFVDKVGWFHNDEGAIIVFNEPNGAASWFPVNNHPRDKATYSFDIRVPQPWVAVAPGTLRETVDENGYTHYRWEMEKPMASYLASISIDQFSLETSRGPNGMLIRSYFPPDAPSRYSREAAKLSGMIEYFSSLYGPYPFDEYGILVVRKPLCEPIYRAEEVQTISMFCPQLFEEPIIAHELAHQWFGDSVSLESWQDIWLKEGMGTYAEWLWETQDAGIDDLNAIVKPNLYRFYKMTTGKPDVLDLYSYEVYEGGALVFHALRLEVGDETFFKILQTYLEQYRYGNAGTDEFIAVAEEVSGRDLKAQFDAWLYQAGAPDMPSVSK
jgi:aminopeptidase N